MLNSKHSKLENLNRDELLTTARRFLVEADALSSRISAVNEIGVAINQTLDLATIQRVIAKQAKWLLDFEHCSVCLLADAKWGIVTLFGKDEPQLDNLLETENIGLTLKTMQPQLILKGSPSAFLSDYQSQIIIPLTANGVVLGTINFASKRTEHYTHDDMRIGYMLALQLSSAIRNTNVVNELKETQKELQLRVEELDAYAHTIAHDLKSPLSNILLTGEIINIKYANQIPPEALIRFNSIIDSGKQMNKMIEQLLLLAKLRDPQEVITAVPVRPTVHMALSRFSQLIAEKGIKVNVMKNNPVVMGHPQWIEEVFANLISNAIKYMGDDNLNPCIDITGVVQDGKVKLAVKDTGVGIKDEDQQNLFVMFTRLHQVNAEGLGLGLSIIRRIISKLDGELGVESTSGKGSTFWFVLKQGQI